MKILIAPDKFKGSLTARQAAEAIANGFHKVFPNAEIQLLPLADGGEGILDAFRQTTATEPHQAIVRDALGRNVSAEWIMLGGVSTRIAIIESSQANGMWRIAAAERDPLKSSTYGVGQLIAEAVAAGAEEITIGIGGSATNDAGAGMAAALGIRFLDESGNPVDPSPQNFHKIASIDSSEMIPLCPITVACDVSNPLLGSNGATRIYGPQKGVKEDQLADVESSVAQLAAIADKHFKTNFQEIPGTGAAGGLGYGLMTFCRAKLVPGFDCIANALDAEQFIRNADIVITGEGSLDSQSLNGKTPIGVAKLARKHKIPVYAIAGKIEDKEELLLHFDDLDSILDGHVTLEDAINNASELLSESAKRLAERLRV